jgi:hypothetical protein
MTKWPIEKLADVSSRHRFGNRCHRRGQIVIQCHSRMEVGDLLNARNAAAADAQLRQQLHQVAQMESRSAYTMNTNQAAALSHQQSIHQESNNMAYQHLNRSSHNQQMAADNFMIGPTQSIGSDDLADENGIDAGGDTASKAFACSTCQKRFARRSDLARHGKGDLTSYDHLSNRYQSGYIVEFVHINANILAVVNSLFRGRH